MLDGTLFVVKCARCGNPGNHLPGFFFLCLRSRVFTLALSWPYACGLVNPRLQSHVPTLAVSFQHEGASVATRWHLCCYAMPHVSLRVPARTATRRKNAPDRMKSGPLGQTPRLKAQNDKNAHFIDKKGCFF